MLLPRRLGHSQNPSPQDFTEFSDTLLAAASSNGSKSSQPLNRTMSPAGFDIDQQQTQLSQHKVQRRVWRHTISVKRLVAGQLVAKEKLINSCLPVGQTTSELDRADANVRGIDS